MLNTYTLLVAMQTQPPWMSVRKGLKELVIGLPHQLDLTCLCHSWAFPWSPGSQIPQRSSCTDGCGAWNHAESSGREVDGANTHNRVVLSHKARSPLYRGMNAMR